MNHTDRKFWPFRPRTSIASAILILVSLLLIFVVLRTTINWPSEKSETAVLTGVLLVSLLPILLSLVDVIIERGGVFEYKGLKIDFSHVRGMGPPEFTVPVNVGVPGQPVSDSSTTNILDALKQATACDVVIIDLEDGQAWWETRLLVLLAGAVRLKRPEKVVFIGKDGGIDKCFQGWAHPADLFPYLLKAHSQYSLSYHKSMAAARQWELVEPTGDTANRPELPFTQKTIDKYKFQQDQQDNDIVKKLLNKKIIKSVSYDSYFLRFDDSMVDEGQLRKRLGQIVGIEIEPIIAIWQQSSQAGLGVPHSSMAFDNASGLPNPLLAEQLFASDLGEKVEMREDPKRIGIVRLEELFRPVLHKENIDESWPPERQISTFFDSNGTYIAVTQNGKYTTLISKLAVLSTIVRTLVEKK